MPVKGWMDKHNVVYIYIMECYSAMKRNEIVIGSGVDESRIYNTECSKLESKNKYGILTCIYGI